MVSTRNFHLILRDAKSLIKHFLTQDVNDRYGAMKNGVGDIKGHRWFNGFDFDRILKMQYPPSIMPPEW